MKKKYFEPATDVVKLDYTTPLLAESIGAEGGSSDGGVTPGTGDPSSDDWGSDY